MNLYIFAAIIDRWLVTLTWPKSLYPIFGQPKMITYELSILIDRVERPGCIYYTVLYQHQPLCYAIYANRSSTQ